MSMHEGLPVAGYNRQTTTAIDLVNANKIIEEQVLRIIGGLRLNGDCNPRWLSIAQTQIEQGFMALNRAVFQPSRIKLPSDDEHSKTAAP